MTDKEKLKEIKKLADAMYYAAFNLTTDASLLRKAMKEYRQFIIHEYCKEEPVSEDLGEYINELSKQFPDVSFAKLSRIAVRVAKWQEDKDKQTLNEEGVIVFPEEEFERMKRSLIKLAEREQQMMANTADAMIGLPYENKDGGYTHLVDVSRPLPVGNNKIAIIFKED